ncbi:hypothetical protein [Bellilinea caldifistulae]|uniref:hypothetical protein n=1 Tax=Bellilinea caldifistulae TaxID=360411 RepID=UPI0011AE42AB|nr:hypothetical protein [Bellilinea caldifistulae]
MRSIAVSLPRYPFMIAGLPNGLPLSRAAEGGVGCSGGAGKTPSPKNQLRWLAAHTLKRRSRCLH